MCGVRSGIGSAAQWPPMPDPTVYDSWGAPDPKSTLRKRSYLYHLQPIAVGSAYVESLTGYIARLAEAHSVATGALLALELRPRVPRRLGHRVKRTRTTRITRRSSTMPTY